MLMAAMAELATTGDIRSTKVHLLCSSVDSQAAIADGTEETRALFFFLLLRRFL